jgi:hypothetical protein
MSSPSLRAPFQPQILSKPIPDELWSGDQLAPVHRDREARARAGRTQTTSRAETRVPSRRPRHRPDTPGRLAATSHKGCVLPRARPRSHRRPHTKAASFRARALALTSRDAGHAARRDTDPSDRSRRVPPELDPSFSASRDGERAAAESWGTRCPQRRPCRPTIRVCPASPPRRHRSSAPFSRPGSSRPARGTAGVGGLTLASVGVLLVQLPRWSCKVFNIVKISLLMHSFIS